jgi:hypothetical protein
MAATVIGNALTTRLERKDSKKKSRSTSGNSATYRYTQKVGTAVSNAIGEADPADATIFLRQINFDPNPGGGFETVELVYEPSSPGDPSTGPVGTITFEADSNAIEVPIQQHPNIYLSSCYRDEDGVYHAFLSPSAPGARDTAVDHPGVESYLVPQPTFTRTEVLSSFTFTEANIISAVGTRNAPTGMTSPTADKWLKMRLSLRKSGNVVEKAETWQYAAAGWDTSIYS